MMAPRKSYDHFYEWAGDFTREAMKGWGLGALSFMAVLAALIYLAVMHGGNYLDAEAEKKRAEAKTSTIVAAAISQLTEIAKDQQHRTDAIETEVASNGEAIKQMLSDGSVPAQQVKAMMESAAKLMGPVPALREQGNKIMAELLDVQKEVLQTLQESSKNAPAPPSNPNGGA